MFNMLLGAIGLSLLTDKSNYRVGDTPTYKIQGAIPGSQIAWTSYKNGQPVGGYQSSYGQTVDANGTAELVGSVAWTADDVGSWDVTVLVITPDGSLSNAEASFTVSPASVAPPVGSVPGSTDIFTGNVTLPIIGNVSKPVALIGGATLLFLLFGKKGR